MGTGPEGAIVALSDGSRVIAPSGRNGSSELISQGDRVRVAVRPERLRLAPKGQGGRWALPARVEAAIFVGSFHVFLVGIEGRGGAPLQVQIPASSATLPFQNGDTVDLVINQEKRFFHRRAGRRATGVSTILSSISSMLSFAPQGRPGLRAAAVYNEVLRPVIRNCPKYSPHG
nr:TOBE domain-containing protein [Mesorhizobium sp.]